MLDLDLARTFLAPAKAAAGLCAEGVALSHGPIGRAWLAVGPLPPDLAGVPVLLPPGEVADAPEAKLISLAPDRIMLLEHDGRDAAALVAAAVRAGLTVHDARDAWVRYVVEGVRAAEVLSHLLLIDLSAEQFAPASARLCELARTRAIVLRTSATRFEIFTDPSLRAYIWEWLARTATLVTTPDAPAPKTRGRAP